MKKNVTAKDIAKLCGVSQTTCRTESEKHMKTRIANLSILRIV